MEENEIESIKLECLKIAESVGLNNGNTTTKELLNNADLFYGWICGTKKIEHELSDKKTC